jgi:FMN phosphatase YigB (HAD superfamily)
MIDAILFDLDETLLDRTTALRAFLSARCSIAPPAASAWRPDVACSWETIPWPTFSARRRPCDRRHDPA